ncbi:hypothetical protein BLS_006342 [Venturia inaequalis]|uniref:Transfer RNA methyltransferase 82 n=1 Tax=Venturia inaequalis TaxID=5025 RepID=A0A8H3UBL3_VENIN|nr:hypothetical protein BLS_006342 [Venturia inaequalis]KAE9992479.1 hypothetical protein EG327_008868 [Venturia inaequalis]RDI80234.1 hypothetical protein Vi05172_g9655 [Venturia inaequalis]
MHHPYQRLTVCVPGTGAQFLLAASGHKLFSVNLADGSVVTQWPKEGPNEALEEKEVVAEETEGPPSKKRRLSNEKHEDLPNIIHMVVTASQNHLVVVTAEDKCLRVFEISPEGKLEQLSQRNMPKKPCAIVISPDDKSIYSADKFGDVYSLPLVPTAEDHAEFQSRTKKVVEPKAGPAAHETTVHTKANLRSLESQLKQAQKGKPLSKPKEPLDFPHDLLLGHVSLLTDLLVTTIKPDESIEKPRTYLITSDRDEHVRISRGPPQAYVIEGFCLGHREFINKLCLAEPGLLVSGGGDDELLIWDWLAQKLVNRVNISKAVQKMKHNFIREKVVEEDVEMDGSDIRHVPDEQKIKEEVEAVENATNTDEKLVEAEERSVHPSAGPPTESKIGKIAVSNIWRFVSPSMGKSHLLIAIEGLPALFHFPIPSLRTEKGGEDIGYIPLPSNILDITQLRNTNTLIISVDNIHEPSSTTIVDSSEEFKPRLLAFELVGEDLDGGAVWKPQKDVDSVLLDLNEQNTVEWHEKALQTLLYSVENLRKRGAEEQDGAPEPGMAE